MVKGRWVILWSLAAIGGCKPAPTAITPAPAPKVIPLDAKELPIEPAALSTFKAVELSTLVLDAMPPANSSGLTWAHMLDAPILWVTDGYSSTESGEEIRDGKVRVRVNGRISTVLSKTTEEVPWTVELSSTTNPNFGPQDIAIMAGGNNGDQCFGSLYSNCTFTPEEAFKNKGLSARFLCQANEGAGAGYTRYYRLTADGRADMIAAYSYDDGSGGASTDLSLKLAHGADPVCAGKPN